MTSPGSQLNSDQPAGAGGEAALLASAFSALAVVLFAFYLINLAGQVLPVRLVAPAWQLRFAQGAIASAPMALIGLGLLQLATYIDGGNGALAARRRNLSSNLSKLAIMAAVGFLLLIPLQLHAAIGSIRATTTDREARMQQVRQNLTLLRQQINAAGSLEDLQTRIKAIQAPDLILDAASLGKPLPQIKQALLASVEGSERQMDRATGGGSASRFWTVLQRSFQGVLSCVALAFGFAALARRSGSDLSLLQELRRGRNATPDEKYLREIMGEEPEP